MNIWGNNFKVSIFGESHGNGIGVVIDGIPSGLKLDMEFIENEMSRRAPGKNGMSTPRKEADKVEILSGFFDGKTTGTPLCGIIRNTNTRSKDYNKSLMRPGHADFTGFARYGASHDFRGGGHFSGRITAPLVFAGAIAKSVLKDNGIFVGSHIKSVHNVSDKCFDLVNVNRELLDDIAQKEFPVIDDALGEKMKEEILAARDMQNSVGGEIECAAIGIPAGIGAPFFGSVESRISSMMFSVPAVKGIEFGKGFEFTSMYGKAANDEFYIDDDGAVKTYTNNNAGINGGISNGMPIVFTVAIKPTPSVSQKQRTIDLDEKKNTEIEIHGRHDPCIVHRAAVVVESGAAIALLDMLLDEIQIKY